MSYRVVEVMKCSTLTWIEHLERTGESEMTREIYQRGIDAGSVRG